MDKRLEFIIRAASDLIEENPKGWSGDVNDFVTASAGSLNEDLDEYLTTQDVREFTRASMDREIDTKYDWIKCSSNHPFDQIYIIPDKKS